jgi:hypothetical protein
LQIDLPGDATQGSNAPAHAWAVWPFHPSWTGSKVEVAGMEGDVGSGREVNEKSRVASRLLPTRAPPGVALVGPPAALW